MNTGDPICPVCGRWTATHLDGQPCKPACFGQATEYGRYSFTPNIPTQDDIRRIFREELERAKEKL